MRRRARSPLATASSPEPTGPPQPRRLAPLRPGLAQRLCSRCCSCLALISNLQWWGEKGRQVRVNAGGDSQAAEPAAADSWAAAARKPGGQAACRALRPLLLAVRASPPPIPYLALWAEARAAGRWARRSPGFLSLPAEASMASAALPGLPNSSPEPLLEKANWVLAGAGAAGGEGGK